MFLSMLKRLAGRLANAQNLPSADIERMLNVAVEAGRAGDNRKAIPLIQQVLEIEPHNAHALNDLGVCLSNIGKMDDAARYFELSYSIDDTYIAAITNHAKTLISQRRASEALVCLRQGRIVEPEFAHTDAVYAEYFILSGDPDKARQLSLNAWLANFENLRYVNSMLFYSAYSQIPERRLAAEHRFWADTLAPLPPEIASIEVPSLRNFALDRKIKIGYWSPDLREHSVRYFFRPILENHDKDKYEVYVYHDFPGRDKQTDLIEAKADHFHDVSSLLDEDLCRLLASHELDTLVELAGHTSVNRINLLQKRWARLQVSGLGYPPTTGLSSIDFKITDVHVATEDACAFYTEAALVLPQSLWCFDPLAPAPDVSPPPVLKNGFVTFGVVGNLSKISDANLKAWAKIMARVPKSRLLVRSIAFIDRACEEAFLKRLKHAGLPSNRTDIKLPVGGSELFSSYAEIDIVLDTFPFNGGTTSCFSLYMGVPMVSQSGNSLISRMGRSMLSTLGAVHLAVDTLERYVETAISLSQNISYLKEFRSTARAKMKASALGNGKIFTAQWEATIANALVSKANEAVGSSSSGVDLLPAREIVSRAYRIMANDQPRAAQRVIEYCLRHYPASAEAHILFSGQATSRGDFAGAAIYLEDILSKAELPDVPALLLNICRNHLLADDYLAARRSIEMLRSSNHATEADRAQASLYLAGLDCSVKKHVISARTVKKGVLYVVILCDDLALFESTKNYLKNLCFLPLDFSIVYRQITIKEFLEFRSSGDLSDNDAVLMLRPHIKIVSPYFLLDICAALENRDVVGFYGAHQWIRLDWHLQPFETKAGGYLYTSAERTGFCEYRLIGTKPSPVENVVVLAGGVMAARARVFKSVAFDPELSEAGSLWEQAWSHMVSKRGFLVGSHAALGVVPAGEIAEAVEMTAGRAHIADKFALQVLDVELADTQSLSLPAETPEKAIAAVRHYFDM